MNKTEYILFVTELRKLVVLYRDQLEGFADVWRRETGRLCPFYLTDSNEDIIEALGLEIADEQWNSPDGEDNNLTVRELEEMWNK
jgi:hypothetical protein